MADAGQPTTEERMAFLTGEIHALLLFAQLLAATHPNPQELRMRFATAKQKGLAQIEGSPVLDATVEGFQVAASEIEKAISENPGNQRSDPT